MTDARRAAYRRGRGAEFRAALLLRAKGYRIVARGYRCPVGESDIIARRGAVLVAVEVKARATLASAAEAINPRSMRPRWAFSPPKILFIRLAISVLTQFYFRRGAGPSISSTPGGQLETFRGLSNTCESGYRDILGHRPIAATVEH